MKVKNLAEDMLYDCAGGLLMAVGIQIFLSPCRIALGGVQGIALAANYLTGLPIGLLSVLINGPLLMGSFWILGRGLTLRTVRSVLVLSVILDLFKALIPFQYTGDRLVAALFGGIIAGAGQALLFLHNSTSGGSDIVAKMIQKKRPYLRTGRAIMAVNLLVMGVYAVVLWDVESALYGLITMACMTQIIDMLLYGVNKGTMLTVISAKSAEITEAFLSRLNRGVTLYETSGAYSRKPYHTVMCVVDKRQFYLAKNLIDSIDPEAFVIVSETMDIYGRGFRET